MKRVIFKTRRLEIRMAAKEDALLYYQLWTDPSVMTYVGFPQGLPITLEQVNEKIRSQGDELFGHLLVVTLKKTDEPIGECKMYAPDQQGIAETDVKLLPNYWGHKFGVEVKAGLVTYLFTYTDCIAVQATPNVNNLASIKMQEAVGGVRVGEETSKFPESMQAYTTPVPHYVYHVYHQGWLKAQAKDR